MRLIIALLIIVGISWGVVRTVQIFSGMSKGQFEGVPETVEDEPPAEPSASVVPRGSELIREAEMERKLEAVEKLLDSVKNQKVIEEKQERERKLIEEKEERERKEREKGFVFHAFKNRRPPSAAELGTLLGSEIYVDEKAGVVAARVDTLDAMAKAGAVLESLDVAPIRTAYRVEGVVVTASLSRVEEFSVDWLLKIGGVPGLSLASGDFAPGQIVIQSDVFEASIETAKTGGRLDILARPHLILSPGETATISSGREIPLPSVNVSDGNAQSSIDYRSVALRLEVGLKEVGSDRLTLSIKQVNAQVSGTAQIGDDEIPEISSQEWTTQIEPEFLRWYAVGGVATVDSETIERRGWLFKNRQRKSEGRREIGMFVRVVPVGVDSPPIDLRPVLRAIPVEK